MFSNYKDYVIASKEDNKIDILSEINNMYRTMISLTFSLMITIAFDALLDRYIGRFKYCLYYVGLILLMLLFIFSYKKQTDYIRKRIEAIIKK